MKDKKLKHIPKKFPIEIRDKVEGNCKEGKNIYQLFQTHNKIYSS